MTRQKPMRRPGALAGVAIAMLAASCSPEPQARNGTETAGPADAPANKAATSEARRSAQAARLTVEGEGLRWIPASGGAGEAIPFGTRQEAFLASLERVRGPAERSSNPDCPTGAVQEASWPDGLSLVFERGLFVGWGLSEGATGSVATAAGIGPGDTRAQLDAQAAEVSQSSIGLQFAADEVYGLLDGPSPSARITEMWAGVSCHAT